MSLPRSRTFLAAAAAALLVVALHGVAGASAHRGTTATIRAVGSGYSSPHWSPRRVSIDHGSRVKWLAVNYDHVLVAYGGNWTFHHSLSQGASVTRRFAHAGTFLFRCSIHSTLTSGHCDGMCGKIVVH